MIVELLLNSIFLREINSVLLLSYSGFIVLLILPSHMQSIIDGFLRPPVIHNLTSPVVSIGGITAIRKDYPYSPITMSVYSVQNQ